MKKLTMALASAGLVLATGAAWAEPEAALNKAGCMACHAKEIGRAHV